MTVEKSLPKSKVVQLDSGPYEVKKLPMGRYAQLLQKLDNVPELLDAVTKLDTSDTGDTGTMLVAIRDLLIRSWDDLVGIVSVATGVPEQQLNGEIGLSEAVDLVIAAIEVNDFFAIKEKLIKVFAGKGKQEVLQAQAAAGYSKQSLGLVKEESQKRNSSKNTSRTRSRK